MKAPTLADVARHAGVSYATADRVLNNRGLVAEKSARKVHESVRVLGYVRNVAAANLSRRRSYRFVFLLPEGPNAFFARIRDIVGGLEQAHRFDSTVLEIRSVPPFDPAALSERLEALLTAPPDGVAVVGLSTPEIIDPLNRLERKGVAVVSLVADLPAENRVAFVGIDNRIAGQVAARMVAFAHRRTAGRVLVLGGSLRASDHRDRLAGFRSVLVEDAGGIALSNFVETHDRHDLVEAAVAEALKSREPPSAIYNLGAGNSGLRQALAKADQRPFTVVHELTPASRSALTAGLFDIVIDQQPEEEVRAAIAIMRAMSDRRPVPPLPALTPAIYTRDNIPPQDIPNPETTDP